MKRSPRTRINLDAIVATVNYSCVEERETLVDLEQKVSIERVRLWSGEIVEQNNVSGRCDQILSAQACSRG